jgi:hypothetical protein
MADQKISELTAKTTPVDADLMALVDTEATPDTIKKITWANILATEKAYWDTLYAAISHESTHRFGGADELNIRKLIMAMPPFFNLVMDSGFNSPVSGTGSVFPNQLQAEMQTGATSTSEAGHVFQTSSWYDKDTSANHWAYFCRIGCQAAMDELEGWFGFLAATDALPTNASNHFAFKLLSESDSVNASIYTSSGNGANGTQKDTGQTVGIYGNLFFLIFAHDTGISYVWSSDGGATWNVEDDHVHGVDYLPDDVSMYPGGYLKNNEAVNKHITLTNIRIMQGAQE